MIKSWMREITLAVQARSGASLAVFVCAAIAAIAALTAFAFLSTAGYDWFALQFGSVFAALIMTAIFAVVPSSPPSSARWRGSVRASAPSWNRPRGRAPGPDCSIRSCSLLPSRSAGRLAGSGWCPWRCSDSWPRNGCARTANTGPARSNRHRRVSPSFLRWFTAFEAGRADHAKKLNFTATKLGRLVGRIEKARERTLSFERFWCPTWVERRHRHCQPSQQSYRKNANSGD